MRRKFEGIIMYLMYEFGRLYLKLPANVECEEQKDSNF